MKALTFEEWKLETEYKNDWEKWIGARQGMVPEDECVRLPDISKEFGTDISRISIELHRYDMDGDYYDNETLKEFRRPAPPWYPKIGDPVFFLMPDVKHPAVGIVSARGDWVVIDAFGEKFNVTLAFVRRFMVEHIGKPWEEIPNA